MRTARYSAVVDRLGRGAAFLAAFATLAMTALVSFDVLMRYFLNQPQLFVDEAASFLQVLLVFLGLAFTFKSGGHIRVDLVTTLLPGPARACLRAVTLAVGVILVGVATWVTLQSSLVAYRDDRVSTVMLYPIWVPMLLIPAGLALLAAVMATALFGQLRVLRRPREEWREISTEGGE